MPLVEAVHAHVSTTERLHADDTPVPVLDVGCTRTGRLWISMRAPMRRQQRTFTHPTAAASISRNGLMSWAGLMQADAYAGYNRLYDAGRKPGPIIEAACWAHARR